MPWAHPVRHRHHPEGACGIDNQASRDVATTPRGFETLALDLSGEPAQEGAIAELGPAAAQAPHGTLVRHQPVGRDGRVCESVVTRLRIGSGCKTPQTLGKRVVGFRFRPVSPLTLGSSPIHSLIVVETAHALRPLHNTAGSSAKPEVRHGSRGCAHRTWPLPSRAVHYPAPPRASRRRKLIGARRPASPPDP